MFGIIVSVKDSSYAEIKAICEKNNWVTADAAVIYGAEMPSEFDNEIFISFESMDDVKKFAECEEILEFIDIR